MSPLGFNIGDKVLYGSHGCCTVQDIEMRDTGMYYVLVPTKKLRTKFFVPADNPQMVNKMRRLPTPASLRQTISDVAQAQPDWIEDVSQRRDAAKAVLQQGDERDVLMLVRSFNDQKQQCASEGERMLTSDAAILRAAQDYVRDEFSVVLDIEPAEVDELLAAHLQQG